MHSSILLSFVLFFSLLPSWGCAQSAGGRGGIVFVPVGDSYTIGTGVNEMDRWPNQLCRLLEGKGIHLRLAANPAHAGWTSRDALNNEMGALAKHKPAFCTLLIGVNDWVRGYSEEQFRGSLSVLMDSVMAALEPKGKLLVITIPDFSVTPAGASFGDVDEISSGIARFNKVIREEAEKRHLPVADIYPVSQKIKDDPETVAADGLHPSGKAYAEWLKVIEPMVAGMLSEE